MSTEDGFFYESLSALNASVSRKVISFSDVLAVPNFIVGCNVLTCAMKRSTSFLLQS